MRNLKKFLALVLAMMMAFSLMVTVNAASSSDFSAGVTDKYVEAVEVLNSMGVYQGYAEDNLFHGDRNITRAQVAAILYRVMTSDVDNRQADIYKNYGRFIDVPDTEWYAGYINLMYDWELVKGYSAKGDGTDEFGPNDYVTGYQVLVMFLRAIGYGKQGEFEDSAWKLNAAYLANQLGITKNIDTGMLSEYATREQVASMIFEAIQLPTVTWTQLGGYNQYEDLLQTRNLNPTLGEKNFGLAYRYGVIVGNQSTGESCTKIVTTADDPTNVPSPYAAAFYTYNSAGNYDVESDLGWFGHAVKLWYDNRTVNATVRSVYTMFNESTLVDVVESSDNSLASGGVLNATARAAGFKVASTGAYTDAAYDYIGGTSANGTGLTPSPTASSIDTYALISNSADKTLDLVIALEAEVAEIGIVDNSSVTKTLTLTSSTYGTGGKIRQDKLTPASTKALGANVIAWLVTGTNANDTNKPYYELEEVAQTQIGTVSSFNATLGIVNLANGVTLERSALFGAVVSGILPDDTGGVRTTPTTETFTNTSYIFYLDNDGKYLGYEPYSEAAFIYGTYADYQDGGLGTGDLTYHITGVDLDGNKVINTQFKRIGGAAIDEDTYGGLDVTKKSLADDKIDPGTYKGYVVEANGNLSTSLPDYINPGTADWTITTNDVRNGYYYDGTSLYLTENTKFLVVSGTGTGTLTVTPYNGISALLGDASQVEIDADDTNNNGKTLYTMSPYIFSDVTAIDAYGADVVILPARALKYTSGSSLYFIHDGNGKELLTDGNDSDVKKYEFYQNGVAVELWIDTVATNGIPADDNFYELTMSTTKVTANGEAVYEISTTKNTPGDGTQKGEYERTAASDVHTATINSVLYTVTNAVVIDLTDNSDGIANIANVQELNNAATADTNHGLDINVACVLNAVNGRTVTYIYIYDIS